MKGNCSVVIVDYGMGNLRSVLRKVSNLGFDCKITSEIEIIKKADKLILPGVGHFLNAMNQLKSRNFIDPLNDKVIIRKTPILGICLGMQLFSNHSEEGNTEGLGWIDANTIKFNLNDIRHKIPHMGWNTLTVKKENPILKDIDRDSSFYFVHSYHVDCMNQSDVLTTTQYGYEFVSSLQRENIYGTQFHPEKSHIWGEKMLMNFLNL